MTTPPNIAVIGMGRMGQLYARSLNQLDGARLYAMAEPDAQARAAAQAQYGGVEVVADPLALLALPSLHGVIIATPTDTHAELVVAAAEAGVAIFCEKPLALTLDDTRHALAAVERAGVPLQVGFMRRFDPAYAQAHALIAAGKIGTPIMFKAIGRDPFCPRPEYADPRKSGGLILDMAIHDFDLARWLVGSEVERVQAEGTLMVCEQIRAVGDIDNAVINLRFASGALGNVEVSRNAFYGYDIRSEVLGSEGALVIGRHQHLPVLLLTRDGAQHDTAPYLIERFGPAYAAQIAHFVQCLQMGSPPAVGGAEALAAFAIGLAATQSAKSGLPVSIADI